MEAILLGIYAFFVWLIFIKLKWLPWNITSQVIVAVIPIVALTVLILTLNVVAPSTTKLRVYRYTVPIVSQVRGRVLEVPVDFFFENAPPPADAPAQGLAEEAEPYDAGPDPMQRRETLELIRAYYRVEDQSTRRRVLDLLKAMSGARADEAGGEEG